MAEFDFTIEHTAGKEHAVPDTLSRAPLLNPSVVGGLISCPSSRSICIFDHCTRL